MRALIDCFNVVGSLRAREFSLRYRLSVSDLGSYSFLPWVVTMEMNLLVTFGT